MRYPDLKASQKLYIDERRIAMSINARKAIV